MDSRRVAAVSVKWSWRVFTVLGLCCEALGACSLDTSSLNRSAAEGVVRGEDSGHSDDGGFSDGVVEAGSQGSDSSMARGTNDGLDTSAATDSGIVDATVDGGTASDSGGLADAGLDAVADSSAPFAFTGVTASSTMAGAVGVTLHLEGSGILDGATVTLANKTYPVIASGGNASAGPLNLPLIANTYPVVLQNPGGATASRVLTVNNPAPTVTTLEPSSDALGETNVTLTLTGTSFVTGILASVAGVACLPPCQVQTNGTSLTIGPITNPILGQEVPVVLTNPSPTVGSTTATYTLPWPALTVSGYSLSSDDAGGGSVVLKVLGTNFALGATLTLPAGFSPSGALLPSRNAEGTELTVSGLTLPTTPGLYDLTVANPAPTSGTAGVARVSVLGEGTSCAVAASVDGLSNCGGASNESCCKSLLVAGGEFKRGYNGVDLLDDGYPATVSDFRLDQFEVSVGRFRRFVEALVGGWRPKDGAGKHRHLRAGLGLMNSGAGSSGTANEPGWQASWNANLPGDKASWDTVFAGCGGYATWTGTPAGNEQRPISCIDWYSAYAFCIWDGGFLPSDAEWNYAAVGGNQHRYYPWSTVQGPEAPNEIGANYASYYVDATNQCMGDGKPGCSLSDLAPVGSRPAGNGRWGQADLGGNVHEWNLDWIGSNVAGCIDCANVSMAGGANRSVRGGKFNNVASFLRGGVRYGSAPGTNVSIGARCARVP